MTGSDLEPLYKLLSNSKAMQYLEAPYTKEQAEIPISILFFWDTIDIRSWKR